MIAKSAANIASRDNSRVSHTRPKAPLVLRLECDAEVPLAGVNDYSEYLGCVRLQPKELQKGVQGLGAPREAFHAVEIVQSYFAEIAHKIERGDSAADTVEIQWWMERRCMFWVAHCKSRKTGSSRRHGLLDSYKNKDIVLYCLWKQLR